MQADSHEWCLTGLTASLILHSCLCWLTVCSLLLQLLTAQAAQAWERRILHIVQQCILPSENLGSGLGLVVGVWVHNLKGRWQLVQMFLGAAERKRLLVLLRLLVWVGVGGGRLLVLWVLPLLVECVVACGLVVVVVVVSVVVWW